MRSNLWEKLRTFHNSWGSLSGHCRHKFESYRFHGPVQYSSSAHCYHYWEAASFFTSIFMLSSCSQFKKFIFWSVYYTSTPESGLQTVQIVYFSRAWFFFKCFHKSESGLHQHSWKLSFLFRAGSLICSMAVLLPWIWNITDHFKSNFDFYFMRQRKVSFAIRDHFALATYTSTKISCICTDFQGAFSVPVF